MTSDQLSKFIRHLGLVLGRTEAARWPDADLLKRYVQARDDAAFEALVRRHGPMVLGVCRRVLRNLHDAEDAFQATFLVLVRKAPSLRSPRMLGNWLYGVAYRTALQARKASAKRRAKEAEVRPPEPSLDAWSELQPLLDQELDRLPDKYRVLVVLCDLEGRSRHEVAGLLGLPEGTIASRLDRARKMLAKRLANNGLPIAAGSVAGALTAVQASASVPVSLCNSTAKAAAALAAGSALAGVVPSHVVALTQGVLKIMLLTKLKNMTVVLLAFALLGTSAAGLAYQANAWQEGAGVGSVVQNAGPETPPNAPQVNANDQKDLKEQMDRLQAENMELRDKLAALEQFANRLQKEIGDEKQKEAMENKTNIIGPLKYAIPSEMEALVGYIKRAIEPTSWDSAGGTGSIEYFPTTSIIVLNHNQEVYNRVFSMVTIFEKESKARAEEERKPPKNAPHINAFVLPADFDGDEMIKVITSTLEPESWTNNGGTGGIAYHAPTKSLVVSHTPHMQDVVGVLLARLTATKRPVPSKGPDSSYVPKVYNVADLVIKDGDGLIRVITNTIDTSSWPGGGGGGSIEYFADGRTLVVRNSPEVHSRIESLLAELRKVKTSPESKKGR